MCFKSSKLACVTILLGLVVCTPFINTAMADDRMRYRRGPKDAKKDAPGPKDAKDAKQALSCDANKQLFDQKADLPKQSFKK